MNMYQKREQRKNNKSEDNKSIQSTSINWYPGHMAKTKKQIVEDIKLVDLVIEVLDARIPISSKNPDIETIIKDKKRIVLLNKSDLADEKENAKWVEYFKSKDIKAIKTNCNLDVGMKEILKTVEELTIEECEKARKKGIINKKIRIMILGIPNVGKSSLINKLIKKNSANIGNKPGVTKQKQWIPLGNYIELLDTPGVLWPKLEENTGLNLAYIGSIKDEILQKTEISFYLLKNLYLNYKKNVFERYKIEENQLVLKEDIDDTILELIDLIGKKRGCIVSGGNIDTEKVSNIIIEEFRTGKLGKITLEKL